MLNSITRFIEDHQLLPAQGKVIVAVSGGADSLCLLHTLHSLCGPGKQFPTVQLHIAHVNHQLRGEDSERDEIIVKQLAEHFQLPITTGRVDVYTLAQAEHRSLEEAARLLRYRFLREVAQGQPIAVAHHKDDQVETLLLHWLRGGGLASMIGLQPKQRDIIRPLLGITHAEALEYCAQHNLIPTEDESNQDPRFVRNRIRHEVLPLLESINPGLRETVLRNAEIMQIDYNWLETQVGQYWSEVVHTESDTELRLSVQALLQLPLSLQRHLLRRATAQLVQGQSPLELRHYRLLEELLQRPPTAETLTLHFPQHLHARRSSDILEFKLIHDMVQEQPNRTNFSNTVPVPLKIPGTVVIPNTPWTAVTETIAEETLQQVLPALQNGDWYQVWQILPSTRYVVYVDADQLDVTTRDLSTIELSVRTRSRGDRMRPLGMAREKKIQDVLVDKHIPRDVRAQIPLFFSKENCIWLAGVQLDDRVRLTSETRRIVRLSIIQTEQ
ncbi:MAG TPA: tRNA lysidine(34) synthetase TilS [Dictyobacter sp.]|nr:tRNA lysidine(34) synthetase TilS [Dictyobacter sp.]